MSKEEDEVILVGFLLERNTHTKKKGTFGLQKGHWGVFYICKLEIKLRHMSLNCGL